jgi:Ca-activated chloride channel family protein
VRGVERVSGRSCRLRLAGIAAGILLAAMSRGANGQSSAPEGSAPDSAVRTIPAVDPAASTTPSRLSAQERRWVEEVVAPLISPEERKVYLSLAAPYQRAAFQRQFWKVREQDGLKPPLGPGFRARYERRLEIANDKYGGWRTDAGRVLLALGEPQSVTPIDCPSAYRPIEIWSFPPKSDERNPVRLVFYREFVDGPLHLWTPAAGTEALLSPANSPTVTRVPGTREFVTKNRPRDLMAMYSVRCTSGARGVLPEVPCFAECEVLWPALLWMKASPLLDTLMQTEKLLGVPKPAEFDWAHWKADQYATPAPASAPPAVPPAPPAPAVRTVTAVDPGQSTTPSPPSAEDRRWVEEKVAPLITEEEKRIYLSLAAPYQRTEFRREFWRLREQPGLKPPFGPGFKSLYEDRLAVVSDKYGGWRSDAGRVVLALGEPVAVTEIDCPSTFRPIEIWTVESRRLQTNLPRLIFYRDYESGPLKLWTPSLGGEVLLSPAEAAHGRTLLQVLVAGCGTFAAEAPCLHECDDLAQAYSVLQSRGALGSLSLVIDMTKFPAPPEEDWGRWRSRFVAGSAAEGAAGAALTVHAPPAGPAANPVRKLTKADRKQLEAALPPKYRTWLEGVDIIMTPAERDIFLQIRDDVNRDSFIEQFWRRRSTDRDGIRTNFEQTYKDRLQYARQAFGDLHSDAAKVYLLNGPPDAVIPIRCEEYLVPIQIWYYDRVESIKSKLYLVFYRRYGLKEWTLWTPIDSTNVLNLNGGGTLATAQNACFDADTLRQAIALEEQILGPGPAGMAGLGKIFSPPVVQTEGIDRFLGMTTQLASDAAPIPIDKKVIFPEERNNKIACDISVLLPRGQLALRDLGQQKFYDIDLVGEVIKDDRLLDNFKYRFDLPVDEVGTDQVPLTIRRYLYPGTYELRLKASDANHKAEGRLVEKLTVPEKPDAPLLPPTAARAMRPAGALPPADFRPSAISILPPVHEILTGLQRFETKAAEGVASAEFYLDGTKIITRTRPPFEADLNLGALPRKHVVRVVAYDHQGRSVGEDDLTVNEGSEAFRVKIVAPRKGLHTQGPVQVLADATAPPGRKIEKMEFYSNETKVATLYQPPWEQVVPVQKGGSLGYVRVVGTLDDGLVAEDLRYVNAPKYISEVNVDAVELYTTVTQGNRPVTGLTKDNFRVFEDGQPQTIAQFEHVTNLPISVGVAIDTSASMIENLPEAEKAALEFIDRTVGPKDRAFTMSFDDAPYTLCRLTSDRQALQSSFAGLRAEGSTALYDSIVYGLFQFQGVKGKKALVVLTDGKDTTSRYDFDTLLDYVKKAGVSVYGIGLNISRTEIEVKSKLNRLAEASGGTTFYIRDVKSLPQVYTQINNELRSQYLLTYYSTNTATDAKWRAVEVKTTPTSLKARTISGYYP